MKQVSMVGLMSAAKLEYVEEFGALFEQFGLARMVGRVLRVLLISDPLERSAEGLAEVLRARRGSISSATRTLVQMGLVGRLTKPGERRDYFRVRPGAWRELMRREMEALAAFRRMAERGLGEMHDFYAYWEREMSSVLER